MRGETDEFPDGGLGTCLGAGCWMPKGLSVMTTGALCLGMHCASFKPYHWAAAYQTL